MSQIIIGKPQGSVLRPFLFLVYINDLPNSCKSDVILYADDSVMICSYKNTQNLTVKRETDFRNIENWIKLTKLTLNYKKTIAFYLFTHNNCKTFNDFRLKANNYGTIAAKSVVKYLGIMIDSKLTWEFHTQYVVDKLRIAKCILSNVRHYAPILFLRNFTYSHRQYRKWKVGAPTI